MSKTVPTERKLPRVVVQVGAAVRRLRAAQGLTLSDVAGMASISPAMLSRLDMAMSRPASTRWRRWPRRWAPAAPRCCAIPDQSLSDAQLVRKGEGLEVVRRGTRRGHTYHLLASDRGPRRAFEPFLVTLNSKSEIFPEFEHPGTEFIHILEGSLRYRHGTETYLLKPGDTLTFRGDVPHGPDKLLKLPIRMLSIIVYGGSDSGADSGH